MAKEVLGTIDFNGKVYTHWVNTTNGVTTLEDDVSVFYTIDADDGVFDRAGKLGTMGAHWNFVWYFDSFSDHLIECNTKDRIKAERTVFEYLLGM